VPLRFTVNLTKSSRLPRGSGDHTSCSAKVEWNGSLEADPQEMQKVLRAAFAACSQQIASGSQPLTENANDPMHG